MLAVETHGAGRELVVLPWFGVDAAATARAVEPVIAAVDGCVGWARHYVDLPGTGASPAVAADSEAQLSSLLDLLASYPTPVAVLGLSYGGYLAAAVARRVPERLSGLLHVTGGVSVERDLSGLHDPVTEPGWLDAVPSRWHAYLELAVGHQSRGVAAQVAALLDARQVEEAYLEQLRGGPGYHLHDESAEPLTVPTTVMVGRCDRIVGIRDQRHLGQRYVAVAQAGHFLPLEQPSVFGAELGGWLAGVTQP